MDLNWVDQNKRTPPLAYARGYMIYFGWSDFDPIGGSSTSIDPLRSLANSVRLGEMIFPGSSGRIWRPRYLSALCFLMKHADLEKDNEYRANYIKFRRHENAFILCLSHLKKRYANKYDFNRVIGLEKAEQLVRANSGGIQIDNDILANQMNLGPLGVHSVLLKSMELVDDERELILLPKGERLADIFEASLGTSAKTFLESLRTQKAKRVHMESFDAVNEAILFELRNKNQRPEQKALGDLLQQDDTRRQLFADIQAIPGGKELIESQFIDSIVKIKSPLQKKYQLIRSYDLFQRILHYYFDYMRQVTKEDFRFQLKKANRLNTGFTSIKTELVEKTENLVQAIESYLNSHEDADGTAQELLGYAKQLQSSSSNYVEFSTFLIQHHQSHQKIKGKAAWISFSNPETVEINPSNIYAKSMPSLKEYCARNMHSYRISNSNKMILDLGLE